MQAVLPLMVGAIEDALRSARISGSASSIRGPRRWTVATTPDSKPESAVKADATATA